MDLILEAIKESIRDFLIGVCQTNLETMFEYVNEKAGEIAVSAGQTPGDFNSGILTLVKNLSDNVMIPIAGIVLTYVLVYELIAMVVERNHGNEIGTSDFFKYLFKMCIAVELVAHTFDITMAFFDLGQYIVQQASGVISTNTAIDASATIATLWSEMSTMELLPLHKVRKVKRTLMAYSKIWI